MAGQSLERREILRMLALGAAASSQGGFSRWSFACEHGQAPLQLRASRYAPRFFSPAEYATLERLTELILPSDEHGPGAREAGAAEFVDFMVWSDPSLQFRFRYGLTWLEARSRREHGRPFRELAEPQQVELVEPLAYRARQRPDDEEGRAFFAVLREHTIMGFYTSRVGLEQLDYPGLSVYSESPGCPHPEDPEHRRLPASRG